jgi:hypothetical protein
MQLVERRLSDLSKISHRIYGVEENGRDTLVQVVAFAGEYGVGSSGNDDAAYMRGVVLSSLAAWDVACVIIDLSELSYSWGYALLGVIEAPGELRDHGGGSLHFPVFIVASDRCRAGLETLLASAPESFGNILYSSLDDAIRAGNAAVGEYLDTTDPGISLRR